MKIKKAVTPRCPLWMSLFLPAAMLIASLQVFAQQARYLTLEEVISLAQKQSPNALTAKHQFRASYWEYRTYIATFMPSLSLSGTVPNLQRSIDAVIQPDGSSVFRSRSLATSSAELGLSKNIGLTGGQLFMKSRLTRLDYIKDTIPSGYLSNPVVIGITQPILSFNPYRWSRKIDPLKYAEAKRTYLESTEQVSIDAVTLFFNLLQAQIQKKIALVNQANYDTMYKIALGRYNLGKIAENELLQLELQYLRANATVETAKLDLENRLFRLKSFLRIQDETPIELVLPSNISNRKIDLEKALSEALINRADALAFERRLLESDRDVSRAKLENRFNANLYAEFGFTQNANDLAEAYKNPLDQQIVTLGVEIPILDWGLARGKIKMAESNQEIVRTTVEQEKIDFNQEVLLSVARFNMQHDQVLIAAKADTVAQKGYDITKARYLIGKISITDLNIAQTEADNSKGNYISALWNYWLNYYQVRKLSLFDFERDRKIMVDFNDIL